MTMVIEIIAGQHFVNYEVLINLDLLIQTNTWTKASGGKLTIRIAPRAEQIMHPTAHSICSIIVPSQRVTCNRDHRPQERQTAPQSIESAHVRGMQLLRPARPEPLFRILYVPDVEVANLGTLRSAD